MASPNIFEMYSDLQSAFTTYLQAGTEAGIENGIHDIRSRLLPRYSFNSLQEGPNRDVRASCVRVVLHIIVALLLLRQADLLSRPFAGFQDLSQFIGFVEGLIQTHPLEAPRRRADGKVGGEATSEAGTMMDVQHAMPTMPTMPANDPRRPLNVEFPRHNIGLPNELFYGLSAIFLARTDAEAQEDINTVRRFIPLRDRADASFKGSVDCIGLLLRVILATLLVRHSAARGESFEGYHKMSRLIRSVDGLTIVMSDSQQRQGDRQVRQEATTKVGPVTFGAGAMVPPGHRAVWDEYGTLFHVPVEHLGRPALWPTNTAPTTTAHGLFNQTNRLAAILPHPDNIIDLTRGSTPAAFSGLPDLPFPQVTGMDTSMSGLGVQPISQVDPQMMLPTIPADVQAALLRSVEGEVGIPPLSEERTAEILLGYLRSQEQQSSTMHES